MSDNLPLDLIWKKHELNRDEVYDGDVFLVAIQVKNEKTGKMYWQFEKLRISCDGDEDGGFFDMVRYDDNDTETFDDWSWEDFEYSIKLKGY